MVAQVLAELQEMRSLSDFDLCVLYKMKNYTKPIKTKFLARRLNTDQNTLMISLNRLRYNGLVFYKVPKRSDDKLYYGWLIV